MSTWRIRAALACLSVALWASFAGCGGRGGSPNSPAAVTVRIGTFVDPGSINTMAGMQSSEPLVALAWDGRPVFRLAESAVESADGTSFSIKLRGNVKFHSGEVVKAERVRELLLPKLRRQNAGVAELLVTDEGELEFVLTRAHAFKVADLSDYYIDDDARPELRTGPFRITARQPMTTLERFPDYYQGTPSVDRVEIHRYPNHRTAWTAMMRGEVNFLHEVSRDAIEFAEEGGDIRIYPMLRPFYSALVYNLHSPVLQRREVRLALNEAIDRDEIVRNGMRGHGEPAEGPFWPHHWAYAPGRHTSAFNPEAARLRLDAAGLPLRQHSGEEVPSRFSFTCLVPSDDARFERMAIVLQRQLFTAGIDMKIEALPRLEMLGKRVATGAFDAFLFEMGSRRALSTAYSFWHSGGMLPIGYSAADVALERMRDAGTEEETRVAVSDVMRIMQSDPPAAFLVWPREARAADRSLDVPYEQDREVLGNLWQVRRAVPQAAGTR